MPVPPYMPRPNPEDENEAQAEEYMDEVNELPPLVEEAPPSGAAEAEAAATEPEIVLPTMAQYETNGGPLGCCMGIVVGVLISLLLGIIGFGRVTANLIVFLVHVDTHRHRSFYGHRYGARRLHWLESGQAPVPRI